MSDVASLAADDIARLDKLASVDPAPRPSLAFVAFAEALGKDLDYDFQCADLRGFDLRGQVITSVDLDGADLRDADLRGCELKDTCLREGAVGSSGVPYPRDPYPVWQHRWSRMRTRGDWRLLLRDTAEYAEERHDPEHTVATWQAADTLYTRAVAAFHCGRVDEAEAYLNDVLALGPRHSSHATIDTARLLLALVLSGLGRFTEALGELEALRPTTTVAAPDVACAEAYIRVEADLDARTDLVESPSQFEFRQLSVAYIGALAARRVGDFRRADACAADWRHKIASVKRWPHPEVLSAGILIAELSHLAGDDERAEGMLRHYLPLEAETKGNDHPDLLASRALLAASLCELGLYDDSKAAYDGVLRQLDVMADWAFRCRQSLYAGAVEIRLLIDTRRYAEAHDRAIGLETRASDFLGEEHAQTQEMRRLGAEALANLGQLAEAALILEPMLARQIDALAGNPLPSAITASLLFAIDPRSQSLRAPEDLLNGLVEHLGPRHRHVLTSRYRLALHAVSAGDEVGARSLLLELFRNVPSGTSPKHVLLRAANNLSRQLDGLPLTESLIV